MDSTGSQMLLFHDCFPLLGSSQTTQDSVSAPNENITFKLGSDQSGKRDTGTGSLSCTQRLHSLPSGSISLLGKLRH